MSETQMKASKIESQPATGKVSRNDGGAAEQSQTTLPSLRSLRVEAEIYAISRTLECQRPPVRVMFLASKNLSQCVLRGPVPTSWRVLQ